MNQIFGIYPARPGDIENPSKDIQRIEMYNFALNRTTVALVDIVSRKVVEVQHLDGFQPDIPDSLKNLALELARSSSEVIRAFGGNPKASEALMASTKTSLNGTRCERSRHLCVAPTFVKGEKALWAITDLTDLVVSGIRWTNVGNTGPALVTEKKLQNDVITENFCDHENSIDKSSWKFNYHLTSSDGLEILEAHFKGHAVIKSIKLVDWHVRYSQTDGFGYSDAIGCPIFSQAAVVANQPPKVTDIKDNKDVLQGFALEQTYFNQGWPTPCNYNYTQRYEFYNDGRFRVSAASIGRGCGNDGTYAPVFRIAFANSKRFFAYDASGWKKWNKESWSQQGELTRYFKDKYLFKIEAKDFAYFLEPSKGQFSDGGRGDFAYTYVTKAKKIEGESNLITVGPCCNSDYRQGPEKFMEPEAEDISGGDFVLWYVPQLKNDDRPGKEYCWAESVLVNGTYQAKTYPCYAGPMFVPVK